MNRLAFVCAVLLATSPLLPAANPKIMVVVTVDKSLGSEDPDGNAAALENMVAIRISKEFPCVECITPHEVRSILAFARMRALIGVPADQEEKYEQGLKELAGAMGVDYLVVLKAASLGGTWIMSGMWLDTRKVQAIARRHETFPPGGNALLDGCERVADQLIDDVAYFEICPYTGPVKVKIHSSRSARPPPESRPTYCNGQDQQYLKTTSKDWVSDFAFDLTRTWRAWAEGTFQGSTVETEDLTEEDPCHLCPSGSRGPRIYTEHKRTELKITGFSEESSTAERRLSDVRLYLKFEKDGTYRLEMLGATKPGTRHVKIKSTAQGVCDTKTKDPVDTTVECDVPLPGIFGPFQGTPRDKVLSANQEYRTTDPVTKEDSVITVDFQLQRK